jgi:hypothetical protein
MSFADEARNLVERIEFTRRWALHRTRPIAAHNQRTTSTYIFFGAICPNDCMSVALVLLCGNTHAMNLRLAEIKAAIAPGPREALLADQAGFALSLKLVVPPNITIVPLPPKRPELNPVENI